MVLTGVLEPILRPLLVFAGPFWSIVLLSLFISLLTTLVYKFATDQRYLHSLKADLKRYQKKMMASKDNPEKAMKLQKEVMKLNGEYMKHSLKSTLYTFLPIILFFGWMQVNLAFVPILPGDDFTVTATFQEGVEGNATLVLAEGLTSPSLLAKINNGTATWTLKGEEGVYDASISVNGEEQFFEVAVSTDYSYKEPVTTLDSSTFKTITVNLKKQLIFENVPLLKSIPWVSTWGWFGAYFLFSIVFSTSFRKAFKLA